MNSARTEYNQGPFTVPATASAIDIDGSIDEAAWDNALAIELEYEFMPGDGTPAPVRTTVLLTYDKHNLYVAFRCFDSDPAAIRAHLRDRDDLGSDDWVGVVLDTFNDERRSFNFSSNPLGSQLDMIKTEEDEDTNWDAIWNSAGRITAWGYSVEMAIPFNQLRFQRSEGSQTWGFDAIRYYPRSQIHQIGSFPRDRANNCYLCQALKIEGFQGASPGRNLELAPTFTASRTEERSDFPSGRLEAKNSQAEFGLNARWGITPSMALNFSANPDFSQVEADALQLDVNRPFEIFYPEKRPFFTEGVDFFQTSIDAVYTRMMRDPDWGLKVSGKEGSNTIGAYVVRDKLTNLIFPGSQYSLSTTLYSANTSSVFRYKRDIGNKYTLGLLATDREGEDYFNRLFGFDGDFRITSKDRLTVQLLASDTEYPDLVAGDFGQQGDDFGGRAIYCYYIHDTRSDALFASYQDYSEGFRADLGYLPRVDYREFMGGWSHTFWSKPGDWWSFFIFGTRYLHIEDQQGHALDRDLTTWLYYRGSMQSAVDIIVDRRSETYNGLQFDQTYLRTAFSLQPNQHVNLRLDTMLSDRVDYVNTRPGKIVQLSPGISLDLGLHVRLSFDHSFERMTVDGGRLYLANISRLESLYQFNTRSFFRALIQYVDYRYNSDLYYYDIDPQYRRLYTQLLFSYKLNPQTVMFVGYSDSYRAAYEFGLTQADRTFFVKLGYAWLF